MFQVTNTGNQFIINYMIKITGNLFLRKTGRQKSALVYTSEKPETKNKL